jgi:hypothetical protein
MGSSSMHNFKNYLTEGRDSPLYHATRLDYAERILKTNTFESKTRQRIKPIDGKSPKEIHGWEKIHGVSTSRSLKYSEYFMKMENATNFFVTFELNQRLLSQAYKMVPINYNSLAHYQYNSDWTARVSSSKQTVHNEYEEFIIGAIKNASKYITKIIVPSADILRYLKMNDNSTEVPPEYPLISNNPKLFFDGKFINA